MVNLSNEKRNEHVALSDALIGWKGGFKEDAMTVSELFAVACGLSLLFLFASFWQGDDSGGWA
jgi:hypothetical protein